MGAGHRVTALYELIPTGQPLPPLSLTDSALVVTIQPDKSVKINADDLFVVQLRYKQPTGAAPSQLLEYRLNAAAFDRRDASENLKLASAVAEFGLLLRDSKFKGNASYTRASARAREAAKNDASGYRSELASLIEKAGKLAVKETVGRK
jgi:Ca-activated chloride channel homolog